MGFVQLAPLSPKGIRTSHVVYAFVAEARVAVAAEASPRSDQFPSSI